MTPMSRQGDNHPNWKGGRYIDSAGYVQVRIGVNRYRREHRVVAEKMIGRPLAPGECVHHLNGCKTDNRPENLEVLGTGAHTLLHWQEGGKEAFQQPDRPNATCHPDRPHHAKGQCKNCYLAAAQKAYRARHPERAKASDKAQKEKNYSKHQERKRERYAELRAAGMSAAEARGLA
ncbi:HNH endonuclease [Plastorhodobacter daqingensis]|uniref:HNH endonuclease n=1 Tax=Plastorhodobacter daqingensis TaxID=1387281 RepID=A0ABW2UPA6_9RHOB